MSNGYERFEREVLCKQLQIALKGHTEQEQTTETATHAQFILEQSKRIQYL
jgi:hypothetical protein